MAHTESGSVIHCDPVILGGTPVFVGTPRAVEEPDRLSRRAGHSLDEFLDDFPTVHRGQVIAALEEAKEALIQRARAA